MRRKGLNFRGKDKCVSAQLSAKRRENRDSRKRFCGETKFRRNAQLCVFTVQVVSECPGFPFPHLKNKTAVLLAFKNYRPSYFLGYRQRPILPGRFQPSTFGAKRLNFCVRNGNRWVPLAIVTGMVECVLHTHNYTAQSIDALFRSLFLRFCDQALDLLVSVSSIHYCTYTPDLSTL